MVNFGFPAFLRILCLNEKPQKREMNQRLRPSSGNGYDFHTSLRLHGRRLLMGHEPIASVLESACNIKSLHERQSALAGLRRLEAWRFHVPGTFVEVGPTTYVSPNGLFTVKFQPIFGIRLNGRTTAFQVWNTKGAQLSLGTLKAALLVIADAYELQGGGPDDIGVLSLREEPAAPYVLGDASRFRLLSASIIKRIENLIRPPVVPPQPDPGDRPWA